ncbi:hypothetical protein AAFN60_02050 [Roseibacillus persicicus]|uniref:hypothetical protein n=1 Tax=Roseibacillus persicicus TaxID=454148 RepID=UPI00398B9E7F
MKSIFRLSQDLLVNFAQVRCILRDDDGGTIVWLDGSETEISHEEASLAISRHREIYEGRED